MKALEIGSGPVAEPAEDWAYLDARNLPNVDYVQSAVDLGNIPSYTFDLVVATDVIEHLSWWDVPKALREWLRVLRADGRLEVETPNALELVEMVLHPANSSLSRWGQESDWQRFSRTAFGHQDYRENWHGCYFTREWLTELLVEAGGRDVETMSYDLRRMRLRCAK